MEHANIVIIEDNEPVRQTTERYIRYLGHNVTAAVATLETALSTVNAIEAGTVACDAVILDANLSPASQEGDDGAIVAARLRQLEIPVKIIGFSARSMEDYGIRVDYDTCKEWDRLEQALQSL
jgi:CheY-like chemotaxis protein